MSIEVEVIGAQQKSPAMYYPYLAQNKDGDVVLFIEDDYGVCLKYTSKGGGCQSCWVGAHREFSRHDFKPMEDGASIRIYNRSKK